MHYRAWFDDDERMVAIFCHNTDLGDGWERHSADNWYGRNFSEGRAFPMGTNIVVHALAPDIVAQHLRSIERE